MGKLNQLDNAAASKGNGMKTLWQFVKFIFVSLIAFVIQAALPALIEVFMSKEFQEKSFSFMNNIFHDSVNDKGEITGLGIFIAANASNVLAQIVSFFINRDKTFNSDAKVAVTLPIYIIFTIALIIFSAWCSTKFIPFFSNHMTIKLASALSGALCGMIQFFIYFPFDKLLFPEKKEEAPAEEAAEETTAE